MGGCDITESENDGRLKIGMRLVVDRLWDWAVDGKGSI